MIIKVPGVGGLLIFKEKVEKGCTEKAGSITTIFTSILF